MIVGRKDELAIEYEIVPSVGKAILGHFCVWARDQRIGDFSDTVVLTAVCAQVSRSLKFADRRFNSHLYKLDKYEAVRVIRNALYGKNRDLEESEALARKYGCFNLTDLGISAFDGLYVFLISYEAGQRLLWSRVDGGETFDAHLALNAYEAIAESFLRQFKLSA